MITRFVASAFPLKQRNGLIVGGIDSRVPTREARQCRLQGRTLNDKLPPMECNGRTGCLMSKDALNLKVLFFY